MNRLPRPLGALTALCLLFTLGGCFKSEKTCAAEIRAEIERAEQVIVGATSLSPLEKAEARLQLSRVSLQVSSLQHDEHRNVCDYYLQGLSRLALK
jgi:hypothetical protein